MRANWTKERLGKLRKMAGEGKSARVIAIALGVTRNQVIGKCYRTNVPLGARAPKPPNETRVRDVRQVLADGGSLADLASKWKVSRPSVTQWCRRHLSVADQEQLAENGYLQRCVSTRTYDLGARLELIDLCQKAGWTLDKIGMALGVHHTSVWQFIHTQAPHGMADALEDYREDEAA